MIQYGENSLSDVELLAVIISETKQYNSIELSKKIIDYDKQGIRCLQEITIEELSAIEGVPMPIAIKIKAAIEIGNRISRRIPEKYTVIKPTDICKYYKGYLRHIKKEVFKIILLNTKSQIICDENISEGTLNSSLVHPREVFKYAIKKSAHKIILMHNHPSGDSSPSNEDKKITYRLIECGKLVGIEVVDHIIIGDGNYYSFKENNIM